MPIASKQGGRTVSGKYSEESDFMAARQLNRQINELESRNNQTIVSSRPLHLGLDISSACNARCIFCLAEKGRRAGSDKDAFCPPEWLDHYSGLLPFINLAIFSSYEALLNPDFPQFVDKLREYYTPFQIFTNGKALTPDLAEYCLQNGMQSVYCSFHSPDPKTYEGIMRGLRFDEVLSNLMHLKLLSRKINPDFSLTLVFCAMRRNIT
ncbi:MAG: radical SAM protein [Desulfovibrionaceae bacterium]|nr:radical SAM protein [Desulfovibrionaceae bacterium]